MGLSPRKDATRNNTNRTSQEEKRGMGLGGGSVKTLSDLMTLSGINRFYAT